MLVENTQPNQSMINMVRELMSIMQLAANNGNRTVDIHQMPYANWLTTSPDRLTQGEQKVIGYLKDAGYILETGPDSGLRISW